MKKWWMGPLVLALLVALGSCDAITGDDSSSNDNKKDDGNGDETGGTIEVIGTSGAVVDMDGTWGHGCLADSSTGGSGDDPRTLAGATLNLTPKTWLAPVTDCSGDPDITTEYEFKLSVDKQVTITGWVDNGGASGAAPTGLESVTTANGIGFTVKSASTTPETQAGADGLNTFNGGAGYCGFTDWSAGISKNILDCFVADWGAGSQTAKGSWVVDETTATLGIYQDEGTAPDADGYPTVIDNFDPLTKQL